MCVAIYGHIWPYRTTYEGLDTSEKEPIFIRSLRHAYSGWTCKQGQAALCAATLHITRIHVGSIWQACTADQSENFFGRKFWPIFGSRWPLFGPPWPSPGLPGLRFNSLDPWESGLDPVSANFRPKHFSRPRKNRIWAFYPLKLTRMASGPS